METTPLGWWKLSTDGSPIGNPGKAGAGTIIRDHNGSWVIGSYRHISKATRSQERTSAVRLSRMGHGVLEEALLQKDEQK